MSKAEGFAILVTQNAVPVGDKAAKPRPLSIGRTKLADISNLTQKQGPLIQEKLQSIPTITKEYIDQLQKENMALVKMLGQRNKIIEQSGIELDRLRVNLLKMQEQNQQLALSNTHMLAELNSGKDRLKALQHELGCKNGLLKARNMVLEENANRRPCKNSDAEFLSFQTSLDVKLIKFQNEVEPTEESRDSEKPRNTKRKFPSNSLGSSEQIQTKQMTENTRPSVRRQSARFKTAEKDELLDHPVPEKESISENVSVKNKDDECNSKLNHESQQLKKDKPCTKTCKNSDAELTKPGEEERLLKEGGDDEKPRNSKRSFQSNSIGSSEQLQTKETAANKRHFARRQSARFIVAALKPADKDELLDDPVLEKGSICVNKSVKNEENECDYGLVYEFGRSSLSRPSRVAAKKVHSYKEVPLNVKMRRTN